MSAWHTRAGLSDKLRGASGLLSVGPSAHFAVGMQPDELRRAVELASGVLGSCGLDATSRVVVALNNEGELSGLIPALAASQIAGGVASVGPRARLRTLRTIRKLSADTLITTPCGALDLLAMAHGEHGLDPADLGLRRLVLIGEIVDKSRLRQLVYEFECPVEMVCSDPLFGVPIAHGSPGKSLEPLETEAFVASLVDDDVLGSGLGELVLRPGWLANSAELYRTGLVVSADGSGRFSAPLHTVGDDLVVRGRWVNTPALEDTLRVIDGIANWSLVVSRPGTLDRAELICRMSRQSLVANPMWSARVSAAARTAIASKVEVSLVAEDDGDQFPPGVVDLRGHHLGPDRSDAFKTLAASAVA